MTEKQTIHYINGLFSLRKNSREFDSSKQNKKASHPTCFFGDPYVTEPTAAGGMNPSTASGPPPFDKGGKSGGGGPPARGMSRSDKGSAGSGEDGKVTSEQGWL